MSESAHAFEMLFAEHARPLLVYALRRVERREDAADVVAETMLVAWRRLDEVPGTDQTRPWLFGVARRVLANLRRTHLRQHRLGGRLREQLASATFDHADAVGNAVLVRAALERVSEEDRELLRLTAWEGLSPGAIATVLEMPAATVRTRLHRARARLRAELEAMGETGERTGPAGHEQDDERALVRYAEEER